MGFESSDSAIALVGMDGFRLLAATEVDGELHQLVETTTSVVACTACGSRARSKGRRRVRVRDLPAGGRRVVVVLVQAHLALPRSRLRGGELDRAQHRDRAPGVDDTPGPG